MMRARCGKTWSVPVFLILFCHIWGGLPICRGGHSPPYESAQSPAPQTFATINTNQFLKRAVHPGAAPYLPLMMQWPCYPSIGCLLHTDGQPFLKMAIALADMMAEEREMVPIRIESLPIAEVATARRVVLVGDPPRMMLSARPKKGKALALFEGEGQKASPLATIRFPLPIVVDFDLVADPGKGPSIVYGFHGGASSVVRIQSLGAGETLNRPPPKRGVGERRPRFVREGGGTAIVISEDHKRAVYLEGGVTPRRVELCTSCRNAMALSTPSRRRLHHVQDR